MADSKYKAITVILYVFIIMMANLIPDIAVIFDYMAALSISGMQFFLPGVCYLRRCSKTGSKESGVYALSWGYVILSAAVSIAIIVNNLWQVSQDSKDEKIKETR